MADVGKDFAKEYGTKVNQVLSSTVSITGSMDPVALSRIQSLNGSLNRSLRRFDRVAEQLIQEMPDPDDIKKDIKDKGDKWLKENYPNRSDGQPGYTDKRYKRFFLRNMHKVLRMISPQVKDKYQNEAKINESSRYALATFKVLYNSILANSQSLLRVASSKPLSEADPESFDSELEDPISQLEQGAKPKTLPHNTHLQTTTKKVTDKLEKKERTPRVSNEEEYTAFISNHVDKLDAVRSVFGAGADQLSTLLSYSSPLTFSVIKATAAESIALAQAYLAAASAARADLQPGTFLACKAMVEMITQLNQIIVNSVSSNKSTQRALSRREKAYEEWKETSTLKLEE